MVRGQALAPPAARSPCTCRLRLFCGLIIRDTGTDYFEVTPDIKELKCL